MIRSRRALLLTTAVLGPAVWLPAACVPGSGTPSSQSRARPSPDVDWPDTWTTAGILSDKGLGPLELRMTRAAAQATGLVGAGLKREGTDCEWYAGKGGVKHLGFQHGRLEIIGIDPTVPWDADVAIGDTYTWFHTRYPDALGETGHENHLEIPVGNAPVPARYRVTFDDNLYPDSKITAIALEFQGTACT